MFIRQNVICQCLVHCVFIGHSVICQCLVGRVFISQSEICQCLVRRMIIRQNVICQCLVHCVVIRVLICVICGRRSSKGYVKNISWWNCGKPKTSEKLNSHALFIVSSVMLLAYVLRDWKPDT